MKNVYAVLLLLLFVLVPASSVYAIGNIYFGRRYNEQEKFDIKGKILLPHGDVAPRGGLNGKLIKYTYGYKGRPEKLTETPFYIPSFNQLNWRFKNKQ